MKTMTFLSLLFTAAVSTMPVLAGEPVIVPLWPDRPPGFQVAGGPERDTSGPNARDVAGRAVIRLGDVAVPQLHVYLPPEPMRNGTVVVICPGGGFNILAWDLEGTEVADWLNSLGVTAAVLKYRVPSAKHDPNWLPPTQDAQRAVSLVRSRAEEWHVNPERIGLMGFSAGGRTAAMASVNSKKRLYDAVDSADVLPHRADFLMLIYPAYLADDKGDLRPEVVVTKESPPAFLVHAYDDPVTPLSSVAYFLAMKAAGAPAELHVYDRGGHGYGLRPTDLPVTRWPQRGEEWLKARGLLDRADQASP